MGYPRHAAGQARRKLSRKRKRPETLDSALNPVSLLFRLPSTRKVVKQEALTKNFKLLLKRCDLLTDDFGNVRVLYSLRHTYVSRRRFEGMSFDDISEQVGTSVNMLEEHYNHFTVSDNPNRYSGHQKRKEKEKEYQNEELKKQVAQLTEQLANEKAKGRKKERRK